jgi:hypothetical protein
VILSSEADQSSFKRRVLKRRAVYKSFILIIFGTMLTSRCRMDEENTLVVQAAYTQSPLNEGNLSEVLL